VSGGMIGWWFERGLGERMERKRGRREKEEREVSHDLIWSSLFQNTDKGKQGFHELQLQPGS